MCIARCSACTPALLLALLTPSFATLQFEEIGTVPGAATQKTECGRILSAVHAHGGKVYAGYGDYTANTGPIGIYTTTPRSQTVALEFTMGTEAIDNFRSMPDGQLWVPSIDRRQKKGSKGADYAVWSAEMGWTESAPFGSRHLYDIVTDESGNLWMFGARGRDATIWLSGDGGVTWERSKEVAPLSPDRFARFYFGFSLDGKVYAQAHDGIAHPRCVVFSDGTWRDGPDLLPPFEVSPPVPGQADDLKLPSRGRGFRPLPFDGRIVTLAFRHYRLPGFPLYLFDGDSTRTVFPDGHRVRDFSVSAPSLYILSDEGAILRTGDLVSWERLGAAPPGAYSIMATGDRIYIGTRHSTLHATLLPE